MKARLLKPGQQVVSDGRVMTFVRRLWPHCQPPVNVFQCEDYRALTGPEDQGLCEMSDARVARRVAFPG